MRHCSDSGRIHNHSRYSGRVHSHSKYSGCIHNYCGRVHRSLYLYWAVIRVWNRFRFHVSLQFPIKVRLHERFQGIDRELGTRVHDKLSFGVVNPSGRLPLVVTDAESLQLTEEVVTIRDSEVDLPFELLGNFDYPVVLRERMDMRIERSVSTTLHYLLRQ